MEKKAPQNVEVHQARKTAASGRENFLQATIAVGGADRGTCTRLRFAAQQAYPLLEVTEGPQPPAPAAKLFHAGQEREPQHGENSVGDPHSLRRRECSFASQPRAHDEKQIISCDQGHGDQRSGSAAAAARLSAQRNRNQGENEACDGEGKSAVKFDSSLAPAGALISEKFVEGPL